MPPKNAKQTRNTKPAKEPQPSTSAKPTRGSQVTKNAKSAKDSQPVKNAKSAKNASPGKNVRGARNAGSEKDKVAQLQKILAERRKRRKRGAAIRRAASDKYTNHHRWFLQNMLNLKVVSWNKVIPLFIKTMIDSRQLIEGFESWPQEAQHKKVQEFILEMNARIEPLNLKISLVVCEATGTKSYVIHVVSENECVRAATVRHTSKAEREYLRVLMNAIVTSPEGHISEIACLNLSSSLTECKLTKRDAATLLETMKEKKWMTIIRGQVYLGIRTVAEFKKYLSENYSEYFERCKLCKEPTLMGLLCPTKCGAKVHKICLDVYYSGGASRNCVGCKKPWPYEPTALTENAESSSSSESEDEDDEE